MRATAPKRVWEPEPVTVTLAAIAVPLPPGSFLQATADGEAALVAAAREWLGDCASVADLFSGLGTFAFALAGPDTKVLAVEAARDAHLACKAAADRAQLPVHALHRDLFRNPLHARRTRTASPPSCSIRPAPVRASRSSGSRRAASARVVYISCNPSSWARDAADAGGGRVRARGTAPGRPVPLVDPCRAGEPVRALRVSPPA